MLRIMIVLACLTLAAPLAAQSEAGELRERASARFREGVELYRRGAYPEAHAAFQQAYDLAPDYRVLFNIGESKVRTGDYLGAIRVYERYLQEGGRDIPGARRAQLEQALSQLATQVGWVAVSSNRAAAKVLLDDVIIGETPLAPFAANVGDHRLIVHAPEGAIEERPLRVEANARSEVDVTFAPPPPLALAVSREPVRQPPQRKQRVWTVTSFIAAGGLGVAAVTTGALAASARRNVDELRAAEASERAIDREELHARRRLVATAALASGAGALAITGTLLWLLDANTSEQSRSLAVDVGARHAWLGMHARF
jgi:tetratricopeptide (TPR) repeat protein